MRVDRAREAALNVLAACRRNGAWIDGALKQVLKRDGLSGRDAAFASRIAYGVMQNRIYLDRCLARCLTQRPEKLEPLLLDILRIGAYQILLMDKVPVNAAVNEAVEMAKAHKLSRAAGLVNAVLRNVDRRKGRAVCLWRTSSKRSPYRRATRVRSSSAWIGPARRGGGGSLSPRGQ